MTKLQPDRPGSKSNLLSLKLPRRGEAGRLSGRSLSSKRLLSSQIAGAQRRSQGCFAGLASGMGIRNVPLPRFGDVSSIIKGHFLGIPSVLFAYAAVPANANADVQACTYLGRRPFQ